MTKYYKKVAVERAWEQPVLTSNGTLGGSSFAVGGVSNRESTSNFYKMFDKKTDDYVQFFDSTDNYITFYNPDRLKISSFTISYYSGTHMGATLYGSNDNKNWTKIVDFNHTNNTQKTTISNPVGYLYHKIANIDGHGNNGSGSLIIADICEITINATEYTETWQQCTKEEYDNLPADQRKIVTDIYNCFVRKKYLNKKTIEKAWTQPILSADGTIGGNSFAVYKSHGGSTGGVEAYKAFDGNIDTITQWSQVANSYILFYNPVPLKVSQVKAIWYGSPHSPSYVYLEGSNDNNSYTVLAEGGSLTMTTQTFTVNTNNAYKYFRLRVTGGQNWIDLREVYITATEYENAIKYYKKTIEYEPFVQPILTTDIPLGGSQFGAKFVGTGYSGTYYGYQAFDKNTSTAVRPYPVSESNYLEFYSPNPLKITRLSCPTAFSNEGITSGGFYGSNDDYNWEYICEIGGGQTWTTNVETDKFYKYFKIVPTVVLGSVGAIAELEITATQQVETWEECTKQEYDLLPDSDRMVDSSNRKIENSYMVNSRKKYLNKKTVEKAWTQPVLTSNGTLGGNSFAVLNIGDEKGYPAWHLFDNNSNSTNANNFGTIGIDAQIIYNPRPIRITQIKYSTAYTSNYTLTKAVVYSSNDNVNYTLIKSITISDTNNPVLDLSNNNNFYKYYKIVPTTGGYYALYKDCTITATQQVSQWQPCTKEEYDLLPDSDRRIENSYYACAHNQAFKEVVVERAWEQPVAINSVGGSSFGVQVSGTYSGSAINLFDKDNSTYWDGGSRPSWFTFYNPKSIKVSRIQTYSNNSSWTDTNVTITASNDNSNWETLATITLSQANTQNWDIPVNKQSYYKYYRYTSNSGGASSNPFYEVYITATERVKQWVPE